MSDRPTNDIGESPKIPTDAEALVQTVLREAYRQSQEDLQRLADKLRHINEQKKAIRDYVVQVRAFRATALRKAREAGIDLCDRNAETGAVLARLFEELAVGREPADEDAALIDYALCIPERVPPAGTASFGDLDSTLAAFEEKLQTVGDGAELAMLELQAALQRKQQAVQMLSNISKTQHDTMMAIIRNLKG